ncbi:haloacid dehalogenase type II [Dongia sp.]|uniref:haloacid dehalogenase type II n=1 Tax=Dongia sp. TaxID=1977262 RepID=UPI0037538520
MAAIEAVLFDAYGTLFDLRSAVAPHAARLGDRSERVLALWRQKQLEYTWTASLRNAYRDFDTVTRDALAFALAAENRADDALAAVLMESFHALVPYPDAEATLRALKARGLRLGILSNGTPTMLERLLETQAFAGLLDCVISVDAVKVFKPDRRVYQLGADSLGLTPDRIGFVSGNAWDAGGAAGFGFRVFWLNRAGQPIEYGLAERATTLSTLAEIPAALP